MQPNSTRVLILGGGFSGLGVAIRLLKHGIRDFVILEKAKQIGGTWRENTYPGCACDVPSHLYSYSFAPKTDWTRVFAEQPEIQAYTLDVARRFGLESFIRLETELSKAAWDDHRQRWSVETTNGRFDAQFIVSAQGPLHEPRIPSLPGLERFKGTTFHSARWRHDHDLTGRKVAVIGTGSSAIQFVPKIQPKVGQLFLFQRTAPWVLPKPDHAIPPIETWILDNVPFARRALRGTIYGLTELLQLAERKPSVMRQLQRVGVAHLHRQVKDPGLRRALTPTFTLGCKRLLLSNTYYPSLQAPNAELVPHAVTEVTEHGVIGGDGVLREVDTIIFGTGFYVTDSSMPTRLIGKYGASLDQTWRGSPTAYLGTTCHGFPNAFFMIGPNTGNGHGSAFEIIEAQAGYIVDAIEAAERKGAASIEVRSSAQTAWNDGVQAALSGTVFNAGGCASYYIDNNKRNSTIYPWTTIDMKRRMRRFDAVAYDIRRASSPKKQAHTWEKIEPTPIELKGAVVAITGAAHGIGFVTAQRFIEEGAIVCIGDIDETAARGAAAKLGPNAHAYPLDVSRRPSFERFVSTIEREIGPIDVLVNNAGVMPTGRFLEESDDVDRAAMGVNHWGTSLGMKLVLPGMIERARGHVVNVASLAGKFEVPFMATYVASKHATVGLTGAVRHEIEGRGVTLTTVMPGAVKTRLSDGIPLDNILAQEPDEVARAIVRSVRTRETDVVVPKALAPFVPIYAAAPRAALRTIFRVFRSDRIVDETVEKARVGYETAVRCHDSTGASSRAEERANAAE